MQKYPIHLGNNALEELEADLLAEKYSVILVLVDDNTYKLCYPLIQRSLPKHTVYKILPGEQYKNLDSCIKVWDCLTELEFDRHSAVLNLGGGVIGDMGGFIAQTFKRGIEFLQVPTTLLAMVDASVGGKLGIDYNAFKNQLGLFASPKAVYIYPEFLQTLPDREMRSGFAEVVKHHLIADKDSWKKLIQTPFETIEFEPLIQHSIKIKSGIVDKDPRESGLRKALNFGHTIGHALESYFIELFDEQLQHGEAVSIGMICESHISLQKGLLSQAEMDEIATYILSYCRRAELPHFAYPDYWKLMKQDKKNRQGTIMCTLLNGIGNYVVNQPISETETAFAMDYYMDFVGVK